MQITSEKQRSNFLDNIKCILIFLVVLGHFTFEVSNISPMASFITVFLYSFHMPAFVFVSGHLSKSKNVNKLESILKLVVAYLFFMLPIVIYMSITKGESQIVTPYYSGWYFLALIAWRILTPFLSKFKGITPILFVVALLSGFIPDLGGNLVFAITKIITFFPFFMLGYKFKQDKLGNIVNKKSNLKKLFALLFFVLFGALFLISYQYLNLNINDLLPNTYETFTWKPPIVRLMFFIISMLFICFALTGVTNKKIPLITMIGRNTFSIYLIHRPITMLLGIFLPNFSQGVQLVLSLVFTIITVCLLGLDFVAKPVNQFFTNCAKAFEGSLEKGKRVYRSVVCSVLCVMLVFPTVVALIPNKSTHQPKDEIYRVMSVETKAKFDNSFKLLFCGDLILLEDQVKSAYNSGIYDFTANFEYTKKYITSADFAIGILEGPMDKTQTYSTSNFNDGKELLLNYPEEWGLAIKDAGFDLLSTSNNHALDKGVEGVNNTIDALNNMGIDFAGTYKNDLDKQNNNVKIIENNGLKIAALTYTTCMNNVDIKDMLTGDLSYVTSMIVNKSNKYFKQVKNSIKLDFEKAKQQNPDLIVVIPHWGTQFEDKPDETQILWENIFKDFGADIILGDHTHSVQPVKLSAKSKTFTLYSPGNYANIYREHNGDCSSMVEVYIDKTTKQVIGGSIIPMWTASSLNGNYRPLPIYDILNNDALAQTLTTYDLQRVEQAHKHITKNMLDKQLELNMIQQKYYFDENGFMRTKVADLETTNSMKQTQTYQLLSSANNVCFVGDSVTHGTKNGGVAWYEPLEHIVKGKTYNRGWGSATTKTLLQSHLTKIVNTNADLFVIAIGTNDVRYRNSNCALTEREYIKNLQKLKDAIIKNNADAKFIFVAPWTSLDGDVVCKLSYQDKMKLNQKYTDALSVWTSNNNDCFVNPNIYIESVLKENIHQKYLLDYIHPNATQGVQLYSHAFFM